ncbi:MAG: ABC transporter ATP-binding protein [Rhodospirillaceae bacterium]|nr:ABC transporter ATP-binding protein [Rhodospirillaceae bacterium]MBT5039246.1 ABC transporter ATP-binding protein [Rhodospirillaceae bacterium]MBT5674970.1 ABC transporter ATP-binding protein [Rhodospirillaceae bacterium]MBT5781453.1 ABC transporter ATP-binding protein [Rhodospirillaceae bacterium]MBT7291655.1 ABC transporter ATP-binding protein [Rhodospirillaceae bacterium]
MDFLERDGDVAMLSESSGLWAALVDVYTALGLTVNLPSLLIAALIFFAVSIAFIYVRTVYAAYASVGLLREIRNRLFRHYLGVKLSYSEADSVGSAINDFTTEAERASGSLFQVLNLIGAIILIFAYFGLALLVSVPMTLATVPVMLLSMWSVRGMIRRSRSISDEATASNQAVGEFLGQRLKMLRFIRLSGAEGAEMRGMENLTKHQAGRYVLLQILAAKIAAIVEILAIGTILGLLYLGFTTFELSFGEIAVFLAAMLRLMPRVKELLRTRQSLMSFLGSLAALERRIGSMIASHEEGGGSRQLERPEKDIQLRNVSFAYAEAGVPVLHDINLAIPAGKITALVGPSGSGKSTLIDLLPRLREPERGEILIDGVPVTDFELTSLRAAFSYAPQTPQVFNVSAAEHIGYGELNPPRDQIVAAAKLAGAHDFITASPQGYDSPVGEDGVRLSGGERQRLDLARSLFAGLPILILDEPTSNLDANAEVAFRDALRRVRSETEITMIVVGHRLSTVAIADMVVVLDDGRIVETGTHNELLSRGGWYADAYAKQRAVPSFQEEKFSRA